MEGGGGGYDSEINTYLLIYEYFRLTMWNGGEEYDEPGDFDAAERHTNSWPDGKEVKNTIVSRVDPTNVVNINIVNNLSRDAVGTVNEPKEDENKDLLNVIKELLNTRRGERREEGVEGRLGKEIGWASKLPNVTDISVNAGTEKGAIWVNQTMDQIGEELSEKIKEAEATDGRVIILVIVGVAIVCLIVIAGLLWYRLVANNKILI